MKCTGDRISGTIMTNGAPSYAIAPREYYMSELLSGMRIGKLAELGAKFPASVKFVELSACQ